MPWWKNLKSSKELAWPTCNLCKIITEASDLNWSEFSGDFEEKYLTSNDVQLNWEKVKLQGKSNKIVLDLKFKN